MRYEVFFQHILAETFSDAWLNPEQKERLRARNLSICNDIKRYEDFEKMNIALDSIINDHLFYVNFFTADDFNGTEPLKLKQLKAWKVSTLSDYIIPIFQGILLRGYSYYNVGTIFSWLNEFTFEAFSSLLTTNDNFKEYLPPDLFTNQSQISTILLFPIEIGEKRIYLSAVSPSHYNFLEYLVGNTLSFINFKKLRFETESGFYEKDAVTIKHLEDFHSLVTICEFCGRTYLTDGSSMCDNCRYYNECFVNNDRNVQFFTDRRNSECFECPFSRECLRHIFEYNRNPEFKFFHHNMKTKEKIKGTTYYGVEIEMEIPEHQDKLTTFNIIKGYGENNIDFIYSKNDGSLEYGFEINTQPATFTYLKDNITEILKRATSIGAVSHNSGRCGFHIHINKETFDDKSLANLMSIIYNNWDDFVLFSRRRSDHLNWCKKVYIDNTFDDTPTKIIGKEENRERYIAVNICNENTVEIRLFRGSLKVNTILATLQLTDNLVNLSKKLSLGQAKKTTFTDVVNYNKTTELETYLKERGM